MWIVGEVSFVHYCRGSLCSIEVPVKSTCNGLTWPEYRKHPPPLDSPDCSSCIPQLREGRFSVLLIPIAMTEWERHFLVTYLIRLLVDGLCVPLTAGLDALLKLYGDMVMKTSMPVWCLHHTSALQLFYPSGLPILKHFFMTNWYAAGSSHWISLVSLSFRRNFQNCGGSLQTKSSRNNRKQLNTYTEILFCCPLFYWRYQLWAQR